MEISVLNEIKKLSRNESEKINEFQPKKQLYPNKNLFKDTDYELKRDMEFEDKNELNCQKILFFRGISILILYDIISINLFF